MRIQIQKALSTLITTLILATSAVHAGDYVLPAPDGKIYRYRDGAGKLIISNTPPPAGAAVKSHHQATPATASDDPDTTRYQPRPSAPTPEPARTYVDLNPLAIGSPTVRTADVWWKKIVSGVVENRSGRTQVEALLVKIDCGDYQLSDYVGTIEPRGRRRYTATIIILGERDRSVSCSAGATWTNVF
jgi:hypothetical protein